MSVRMLKLFIFFILNYSINKVICTDTEITYVCKPKLSNVMTHEPITNLEEYCKGFNKPCVTKCCGLKEVLYIKVENGVQNYPVCVNFSSIGIAGSNYTEFQIYKTSIEQGVSTVAKNLLNDFHLVQNSVFENESCVEPCRGKCKPYLLENGMVTTDMTQFGGMIVTLPPKYTCLELGYLPGRDSPVLVYYMSKEVPPSTDQYSQNLFIGVAALISAVFLIPVLVVYIVLRQLRNLSGMLLMAYISTLFLAFTSKAAINLLANYMDSRSCKVIGPIFYFAYLSFFFWLNIMSFDLWWTFRGQRLKRSINRRGELVKFGWYSLYGWGAPLPLTILAVVIDHKRDELPKKTTSPFFDTNMNSPHSVEYYMLIPAGLLTLVNICLFSMTVYNIWLIRKKLDEIDDSKSTKKNENRFGQYLKISMLMGVSWILELAQKLYEDWPIWAYVLVNMYNTLIGVVIFIMFVLNKRTLRMLCKRFNIQCRFLEDKRFFPNTSRSTTKSSTNNDSYHRTPATEDSDVEIDDSEISTNPNPRVFH